ncbi:MAG: FAD-dependent oxidoreductase [Armatimonadia bacterium]
MAELDFSDVSVAHEAEVVVIGGGPAGICAAVAAAEQGADTLLVERYGFLGGMATAGLVNPFMAYHTGGEQINAGTFQRMIDFFEAEGGWSHRPQSSTAFDPELAKLALDRMVAEAGVRRLLHTTLIGAVVDGQRLGKAITASKTGVQALGAKIFIDASGDADLAAWAGAEIEMGRPEDGFCQPMTMNFRMANVDEDRMPDRPGINELYYAAKERGDIENPRENCLWFYTTRKGEIHFNTTRVVKLDATKAEDLTLAEETARKQVRQMVAFLKREVPGFEEAYLSVVPAQIGIRESRRVVGDYTLSVDDVLQARKFEDGIARGCYPVDIHNPAGTGTVIQALPPGEAYDIPYRCLCPKGFDNLLIAGRPISSDHAAHSSHRVMPIAACNGEAGGVAAGMCVQKGTDIRGVDVKELRARLKERGASLYEG